MSGHDSVVIIGGGQAGAQAAQSLRQFGYSGKVTLVSEEAVLPYQRPPLSKAYMKGELAEERLYLKPVSWYENNDVKVLLSQRVEKIDRAAREVHLEHGSHLSYDALIIATGSRLRQLPVDGADLGNVFGLRGISDAHKIRLRMISGSKLVIIGAGYIGLEAAAVARQLGLDVTVLEMADRVLARVTSPIISEFYQELHRAQGVDVRLGTEIARLEGKNGDVTQVVLANGEEVKADIVLVGIGILPNVELAEQAGVDCRNGIIVDEDARTNDPCVFAIGDCTIRPLAHYARSGRLESVHNAIEQGKTAAAVIAGRERPSFDCPWFWSDQYDVKLQTAGLLDGHDEVVVRGEMSAQKFAVFYLKAGRLIAVDAINSPSEFISAKKLIMVAAQPSSSMLRDISVPMKEVVSSSI